MSLIGKPVYHVHDVNRLQFGNVIDEKTENTWTWVKVNWRNGIPTNIYKYPSVDPKSGWFRIDTICVFEPLRMIKILQAL